MPFVYEVNGQRVEFEREPTEKDIDEAAASLKTSAPKEKTTMEKFTEPLKQMSVSDWEKSSIAGPTVNLIKSLMPGGTQQQTTQALTDIKRKGDEIVGGVSNFIQNPGQSIQNVYNAVTENPAGTAGELVKGAIYDPQLLIPGGKVAQTAGKVAYETAAAPVNVGRGFVRGLAYPKGTADNSALLPIRPTYVPHEQVAAFQRGELPASQLTELPSSQLTQKNAVTKLAYGLSPENQQGQKLVPAQGRLMEGIGENIGSAYRTDPLQGIYDIGGVMTGIGPVGTMMRTGQAIPGAILNKATGFDPRFGGQRAAALQAEQQASRAIAPTTTGQTPAQVSQQVAASKITPVQPTTPTAPVAPPPVTTPIPKATTPKITKPTVAPVAPTELPPSSVLSKQLDTIDREMSNLHEQNVGRVDPNTPEGEIYRNQLGDMYTKYKEVEKQLELAKKAEKEANKKISKELKKKGPDKVSQMVTPPNP